MLLDKNQNKTKSYAVAEFQCDPGYKMLDPRSSNLVCSRGGWVGRKPICVEANLRLFDDARSDDPRVQASLEECPSAFRSKCQHLCRIEDGEPTCLCFPGYEMVAEKCKDVDECSTDNGGCQETCTNHPGSYSCSCPENARLNRDGNTCCYTNENTKANGNKFNRNKNKILGNDSCSCEGKSRSRSGSSCSCPSGFAYDSNSRICYDINECDEISTATCSKCVNTIGSYYCDNGDNVQGDEPKTTPVGKEIDDYEETEYSDKDYEDGDYEDGDYEDEYEDEKEANETVDVSTTTTRIVEQQNTNPSTVQTTITAPATETTPNPTTLGSDSGDATKINSATLSTDSSSRRTVTFADFVETTTGGGFRDKSLAVEDDKKYIKMTTTSRTQTEEYDDEYDDLDYEEEDDYETGDYERPGQSESTTVVPKATVNDSETSLLFESTTTVGERIKTTAATTTAATTTETATTVKVDCPVGFKTDDKGTCIDVDECAAAEPPCSHSCNNTAGSFHCYCPSGFDLGPDRRTCRDACPFGIFSPGDARCVDVVCSHGRTRINGRAACTCPAGFALAPDGSTCRDVDECESDNPCAHSCLNVPGSFRCECRAGYEPPKDDGNGCVDVDECSANHHACPQACENLPGSFRCSCADGYAYDAATNRCSDVDECRDGADLHECDQLCVNYDGGYECACRPGYELLDDDSTCRDVDECSANATVCEHACKNLPGAYECGCDRGYVPKGDDGTCEPSDPCSVDNGGCSHGCSVERGSAVCGCPAGQVLEGKDCFVYDPCLAGNGGCSHECVNNNGAVRCECPEDWEPANATACVLVNLCARNNGNCSHECEFVEGKASCLCPELHELMDGTQCVRMDPCLEGNGGCSHVCSFQDRAVVCSCPETHELKNETHCSEMDPCLEDNGGCSHFCEFSDGETMCGCPDNYRLEGKTCRRLDPCLESNGGCSHECHSNDEGDVECVCPGNMYLERDDKTCRPKDPCLVGNGGCSHVCSSASGEPICSCPERFRLSNATHCSPERNPCDIDNGGCSDICRNGDGRPMCSCPDRFNLVNGTRCWPVNPCLVNNGGCSHECSDRDGRASCSCPDGHELKGSKCVAVNACEVKNGGCSHVCSSIEGRVLCRCPPGRELIEKTCFEVNPCLVNNGGCSHSCRNDGGRRACSCPAGYLLRPNGRICKEVNECREKKGGCSHGCRNVPGSFECTCPRGLVLDKRDNRTCSDVDECAAGNGGCEVFCRNFAGGFRCECPAGYVLQKDRRSCKRGGSTRCAVPLAPRNGVVRCLDGNSEPGGLVEAGTKCNVWCNEGYKLVGVSQRVCGGSGVWGGGEPRCVVATCPDLPPIPNGWYLPGICNSGKVYPGEYCKVHCRKGFKSMEGLGRYTCNDELRWDPSLPIELLGEACKTVDLPNAYIRCPNGGRMQFTLPAGESTMLVKIPKPDTNVDWNTNVVSTPHSAKRLELTLPWGKTEFMFTAIAAGNASTTSCSLAVEVFDEEPPKAVGCPENIEMTLGRGDTDAVVNWREPQFEDNVGVANVYKTREPGSEFGAGLHHVTYVANDKAANRAFCHFSVDIKKVADDEESNAIQQQATYTDYRTAGRYRAVLICPSGVQYMTNPPDSYNNVIINQAGCRWQHVKVKKPMQPQNYEIPKVYSESRMPPQARSNRRVFFKWNR